MSRASMYNSTMEVKRLKVSDQDASGGVVQKKTTVFRMPCRIRQLLAIEIAAGGKDSVVSTHRIYCNSVDIQHKDECIINKLIYDVNTINLGSFHKGSMEVDVALRR